MKRWISLFLFLICGLTPCPAQTPGPRPRPVLDRELAPLLNQKASLTDMQALQNALSGKADASAVLPVATSFTALGGMTVGYAEFDGSRWQRRAGVKGAGDPGVGYLFTPSVGGWYYVRQVDFIVPGPFGAVGDADYEAKTGSDATAGLRLAVGVAVALKKTLKLPADQRYRVTDEITIPGALAIFTEPGSELWFDNSTAGKKMIKTRYPFKLTGSGTLTGNWSMAGQSTSAVTGGQLAGQRLLNISDGLVAGAAITVEGITFRRSPDLALYISPNGSLASGPIRVTNCQFYDNYSGMLISNLNNATPLRDVVLSGNQIKRCAMGPAGASFSETLAYGNGLVTWGQFTRLEVTKNVIDSCGRMGVEVFMPLDHLVNNGWRVRNSQIVGNTISNCGYFTLSQQGDHNYIAQNRLKNWHSDYIELYGNSTVIENNYLDGVGLSTTSTDRGTHPTFERNNLAFRGNLLIQRSFQTQIIQGTFAENLTVEKNTIICAEKRDMVSGLRAPMQIDYCLNPVVRQNTMIVAAPFNYAPYKFGRNVGLEWSRDEVELRGYPSDSLAYLVGINQLRNAIIRGVRVNTTAPMRMKFNVFDGLHYPVTGLYSYVWDGSQFVTTPLTASSVQVTPPSSPSTGATYWVGEGATGSWAGQARKLAKWDGSAWSFTPVVDVFPYETNPNKEPFFSQIGVPTKATQVGTTYVLLDGAGLVGVTFDGNDFSAGGKLTDANNKTGFQLFNTRLWNVGVVNTTEELNSNSLQLADVTVQKSVLTAAAQAATTDLSSYLTKTEATSTYTTPSQNNAAYVRPGVPTTSVGLTATDGNGAGMLTQMNNRVLHTFGSENLFLGSLAGNLTMSGQRNLGLGPSALSKLTSGQRNVALNVAGNNLETGNSNILIGYQAGSGLKSGSDNTFIGYQAGNAPTSQSANTENVAIGTSALLNNAGNSNLSVGVSSGQNATFSRSQLLGHNAGNLVTAGKTFTDVQLLGASAGRNASGTTYANVAALGLDVLNGAPSLSNVFTVTSTYRWLAGTYTDDGSYRLQVVGGARIDRLRAYTLSGVPTTTDLPNDGDHVLRKDPADGKWYWFVNNAGTIQRGAAFN